MALSRLIARPMLASMFLYGGFNAVKSPDKLAARAQNVTDRLVPLLQKAVPQFPSDAATLVRLNGGLQLVAGSMLATGRAPRTSAAVLAVSLVPTTAAGHRFWEESDPTVRGQQRLNFLKNISMLGGLIIAAGDTEGRPGVAWRTRRAVKDTRREARHFAASARREARLARARAT